MHTLTVEQQSTLVEIINEEFGSHLEFDDFADKMLGLFRHPLIKHVVDYFPLAHRPGVAGIHPRIDSYTR